MKRITHLFPFLVLIFTITFLSACATSSPTASPSIIPPQPTISPTEELLETAQPTITPTDEGSADGQLVHLWALRGRIDAADLLEVATGSSLEDEICGTPTIAGDDSLSGEVILELNYAPSVIPHQVNLWLDGNMEEILRVEIMNTSSGLSREVYVAGSEVGLSPLEGSACNNAANLPIEIDFEVDTVFITFSSLAAAGLVDAVELIGTADQFIDAPVYWRIPLQNVPASVTVDQNNQVFVADENGLITKFDIEGNLLDELVPAINRRISDLTVDGDNNLVMSDFDFGTYTILTGDGELLTGGGEAPATQVAIEPDNGKLFLLGDMGGLFYLLPYFPGTEEIINPLPLDGTAYTGLAFTPDNRLFTIRPNEGFLVELDPITGLEIYSIPLKNAEYSDALPVEFTINGDGNFYILYQKNDGNSAISVLDPGGAVVRRLGTLNEPVYGDWQEGSYYQPKSIALTPDGRFALIVDGEAGTYYLTCLLLREN